MTYGSGINLITSLRIKTMMNTQVMATAGTLAVASPVWMPEFAPIWQGFIALLGAILLILMILNKYSEWQQRKKDLKDSRDE